MTSSDIEHIDRPWIGAAWKIAAFASYAALNAIARYLSGGSSYSLENPLPVTVIVFFQDSIALLILLPWLLYSLKRFKKLRFPLTHFYRVMASAVGVICWYGALMHLSIADAVAISIVGPIFGVIGAWFFLHEEVPLRRALLITGLFVISLFYLKPYAIAFSQENHLIGACYVLFGAIAFAIAKLLTRKLAIQGESAQSLTVVLLVMMVPVSFIFSLPQYQTPTAHQFSWLTVAGFLTLMAIFCVSKALSRANVSFLASFDMARFALNALIGYLALSELPTSWAIWFAVAGVCFHIASKIKAYN